MATAAASAKAAAGAASPAAPPTTSKMEPGEERIGVSLRGRWRVTLFLLAVFIPGAWLIATLARLGWAATWGDSLDVSRLRRAAALDPGNPEWHYNLGTACLWAGGGNPRAAVEALREATRLSPHRALYWSALGKACYAAGDLRCADQAFERATGLAAAKPRFAWEAGLHFAITGRLDAAVSHLQRLLRLEPHQASQVFEMLLRAGADASFIWRELASSAAPEVRLRYLAFLVSHEDSGAAERFWRELAAAGTALPPAAATRYVEELIRYRRYHAAAEVWTFLRRAGTVTGDPSAAADNLVFNGGFEQPPLLYGLDWHVQQQTYLSVDSADPRAHSGRRALRVEFTVPENSEYEPAYQFVPVVPGQAYLLSAYARAEHITSDSGPRLRVEDPQCLACLSLTSQGTVGTQGWRRVEAQFTVPPRTEVIRVSLWRPRSRSFPMGISGRFWLDDVSLRLSAGEMQAVSRASQP